MAHSPYTSQVVAFVSRNPGCTKLYLARHLRRDARYNPSKLYRLVNTQIRLGNIVAVAGRDAGVKVLQDNMGLDYIIYPEL